MKAIFILTDNPFCAGYCRELKGLYESVDLFCSPGSNIEGCTPINVKQQADWILRQYCTVISIHCKQIFPTELVKGAICINVHPGLNPFNRGWYPQVFSIINGLPAGVTIHEMDEYLDHGPIIAQEPVEIHAWDTSSSVYRRLLRLEKKLFLDNFESLINQDYKTELPFSEGNINTRSDFEALLQLNLDAVGTLEKFLNLLRALSHDGYRNAYFYDNTGRKIYVELKLEPEDGL